MAESLSDLALLISHEIHGESEDLEKVASTHNEVLDTLVAYDQAGRALAHAEFEELEKAAQAGDTTGLEQFFADTVVEEPEVTSDEDLRNAIVAELNRRLQE